MVDSLFRMDSLGAVKVESGNYQKCEGVKVLRTDERNSKRIKPMTRSSSVSYKFYLQFRVNMLKFQRWPRKLSTSHLIVLLITVILPMPIVSIKNATNTTSSSSSFTKSLASFTGENEKSSSGGENATVSRQIGKGNDREIVTLHTISINSSSLSPNENENAIGESSGQRTGPIKRLAEQRDEKASNQSSFSLKSFEDKELKAKQLAGSKLNVSASSEEVKPKLSFRSRLFLKQMRMRRKLAQTSDGKGVNWANSSIGKDSMERDNLTTSESSNYGDWIKFGSIKRSNFGARNGSMQIGESARSSDVVARKQNESEVDEMLPSVTKTSKMRTISTVGENENGPKVTGKESRASLPPALRKRIIERFLKNGGKPQDIVVSDSTITTTSQSKKKTITTVYKIVPDKQRPPGKGNKQLADQREAIKVRQQIKDLEARDEEDYDDVLERDNDYSGDDDSRGGDFKMRPPLIAPVSGAPKWSSAGKSSPLNRFSGAGAKKVKKIMITRTVVPQSVFMSPANAEDANELKGDDDHHQGEMALNGAIKAGRELGEFYQGPQATIFGANENHQDQLMNLQVKDLPLSDKSIFADNDQVQMKQIQEEEQEDEQQLDDEQQVVDSFGGEQANAGVEQTTKGGRGGGFSLNALMDAIKPTMKKGAKIRISLESGNDRKSGSRAGAKSGGVSELGDVGEQPANKGHLSNFLASSSKSPTKKASTTTTTSGDSQALGSASERAKNGLDSELGESVSEQDDSKQEEKEERRKLSDEKRGSQAEAESGEKKTGEISEEPKRQVVDTENGSRPTNSRSRAKSKNTNKLDSLEELKRTVSKANSGGKKAQVKQVNQEKKAAEIGQQQQAANLRRETTKKAAKEPPKERDVGQADKQTAMAERIPSASNRTVESGDSTPPAAKVKSSNEQPRTNNSTGGKPSWTGNPGGGVKTHNIMMLIDFGPPAANEVGAAQRQASANTLTKSGSRQGQQWAKQQEGGSSGFTAHSTGDSNRWRPVESSGQSSLSQPKPSRTPATGSVSGSGPGQQPAVSVQIFNNHDNRRRRASKQAADLGRDYSDVISSGELGRATPNNVLETDPIVQEPLSPASELFGTSAASQRWMNKVAPIQVHPGASVGQFNQGLAYLGGNSPALSPHEMLQFLFHPVSPSPTYLESQEVSSAVEPPILPGESEGTNRLVKEVIEELADPNSVDELEESSDSKASNYPFSAGQQMARLIGNASEQIFTTTSVRDGPDAEEDGEEAEEDETTSGSVADHSMASAHNDDLIALDNNSNFKQLSADEQSLKGLRRRGKRRRRRRRRRDDAA